MPTRQRPPFLPHNSISKVLPLSLTLLLASFPHPIHSKAQCAASHPPSVFKSFEALALRGDGSSSIGLCPLPIDNTISPDSPIDYSPWTHPPPCVLADPRLAALKGQPVQKFCLYTNSEYGANGVSIITTPEVAADTAAVLDESLNGTSEFMKHMGENHNLPFKIVHMADKGLGVIATKGIKQYEEIILDYATLLVDINFASVVPRLVGYKLLNRAVDQLKDKDSVLTLSKSNSMAGDVVENLLRTNSFGTTVGGVAHMAVYPLVSRINHACKPNSYTRFIPSTRSVSIAAAKDILPGEEITISYITLGQPTPTRLTALRQWGFTCTCALCTSSPSAIASSDARRTQIDHLRDQAASSYQSGKFYQALRLTRQVLNMLPSEELFNLESEQLENMARTYWMLGDTKMGNKYAGMSLEVLSKQGYIGEVEPEHLEGMVRSIREDLDLVEGMGGRRGKAGGR